MKQMIDDDDEMHDKLESTCTVPVSVERHEPWSCPGTGYLSTA